VLTNDCVFTTRRWADPSLALEWNASIGKNDFENQMPSCVNIDMTHAALPFLCNHLQQDCSNPTISMNYRNLMIDAFSLCEPAFASPPDYCTLGLATALRQCKGKRKFLVV
jgi:hypothetical protein